MTSADLARALGGEVVRVRGADQVLAPGIGHSARDRSLSVRLGPGSSFTVHSFAGGDVAAERARLQALIGQSPIAKGGRGKGARPLFRPATIPVPRPDRTALWMWGEGEHPWGTRVERYLNKRGLYLPACAAGAAIRSDIHHRFHGVTVHAMLGLVRHIATDQAQAVHRTALSWADGTYTVSGDKRLCQGPIAAGAVKLTPHEAVQDELGVAEGVESALSLLYLEEPPMAVWSLLNANGVKFFPVLPEIRKLVAAVDNDPAGIAAAEACARRWRQAGRAAVLHTATTPGLDLNDIVRGKTP